MSMEGYKSVSSQNPDEAVRRRLTAKPDLVNPRYIPPDPKAIPVAMHVVESTKELMQPDINSHK
jgi:hypothetical protein